jgi:sec-independent protein translocase protein TatA
MGPIGMQEMIFIFILALVLFGPKKLPELGRLLGRGLTEFRRAKNELRTTFESHMRELEREANLDKEKQSNLSSYKPDYSSPRYPYSYDEYGQDTSNTDTATQDTSNTDTATAVSSPEDSNAHQNLPSPASTVPGQTPVNGTVARANGTQPIERAAEEEHRPA